MLRAQAVRTEVDRAAAETETRVIRVGGDLNLQTAAPFCQAVRASLHRAADVAIDLRDAKAVDVVGLAALLQCSAAAQRARVRFSVVAPEALHAPVIAARLCEEIPFVAGLPDPIASTDVVEPPPLWQQAPFVTRTARLGLRQPSWDELALFERWAGERWLDEMVGSDLLYRCRQRGAYHPDFVAEIFASPTSATFLVEPLEAPGRPVGFVRLFDIQLAENIAFLETVVTSGESLRRGWGVEASRLLLAYAMDVFGTQRVEAKVYAYNVLSANALRRNGFHEDGVLRAAHRYHGERWNILVFSILEDELRAQRARSPYPYQGFWSESADILDRTGVVAP